MLSSIIQTICVGVIPLIFAVTLHEVAHGWAAYALGDSTAYHQGRLSLNPIVHVDPVGTILVPGCLFLLGAMTGGSVPIFGWAKPVPVNPWAFRGNRDAKFALTAVAGPLCNLLQAVFWVLFFKLLLSLGLQEPFFYEVARAGISINLMLMAFNLIPIPPLDGGHILYWLLPQALRGLMHKFEEYGRWILLALIVTGALSYFVYPFLRFGEWVLQLII